MTKVVINSCYGGFGISDEAMRRYCELKGIVFDETKDQFGHSCFTNRETKEAIYDGDIPRSDPYLVQVVEELGSKASGCFANLVIVDIPPGTKYRILEYDGMERIETEVDIDWLVA